MRKPRKNYTAAEKVAILRRHLIDRVPVSDLCDEYQLRPTLFYQWQKLFFENGAAALERKNASTESQHQRTIAALRDKLQRKVASLLALAALGGGGGWWLTRQRATREAAAGREVKSTLHQASLLLGRARAAPEGERTPWAETNQAARRAEALLARPEIGADLRREIGDFVAMADRERDQAEARSRDRLMLQRLAVIHTDIDLDLDFRRADREYEAAFLDYGIDVDHLSPADAGTRIIAAPISVEMVDALDQWAFIRRVLKSSKVLQLSLVAKAADPDPWRCRRRDTLELEATDRELACAHFEALAATVPEEDLHSESISRLAYALGALGDKEKAAGLLRRAQRAHPDDFWINHDLASTLMGAGQPNEAVRFYSAAVAIHPRSHLALRGLREALHAAGRPE